MDNQTQSSVELNGRAYNLSQYGFNYAEFKSMYGFTEIINNSRYEDNSEEYKISDVNYPFNMLPKSEIDKFLSEDKNASVSAVMLMANEVGDANIHPEIINKYRNVIDGIQDQIGKKGYVLDVTTSKLFADNYEYFTTLAGKSGMTVEEFVLNEIRLINGEPRDMDNDKTPEGFLDALAERLGNTFKVSIRPLNSMIRELDPLNAIKKEIDPILKPVQLYKNVSNLVEDVKIYNRAKSLGKNIGTKGIWRGVFRVLNLFIDL